MNSKQIIYLDYATQFSYDRLVELEGDKTFMQKMHDYNECLASVKSYVEEPTPDTELWSNNGSQRIAHWIIKSKGVTAFNGKAFMKDHPEIDFSPYLTKRADAKTMVFDMRN